MLVVHIIADCRDAMGANLVNTMAEAVAGRLAVLSGGQFGLRILSNLADRRLVRVTCRVPLAMLGDGDSGAAVRDGIINASRFAELDPYRAATHNKGILNGVDPVVIATGNDWRGVEAGAHAYAARGGSYGPLAIWRRDQDGALLGRLELPMAVGTVGGTLRVHPGARLSLRILGITNAGELGMVIASVGLASNLAALRALATEGIQRGHMSLHARSVAVAAGARGELVDRVAAELSALGDVCAARAAEVLARLTVSPQKD
jgi:hydroxymethylglutaryl-CoA reductase